MLKGNRLKLVSIILLLFALILLSYFIFKKPLKELVINGRVIHIEVSDEVAEITRGLSGRASLCPDCGMLFAFPDYQIRRFWMKDMNFPLDIIWLKDGMIVGFQEIVSPVDKQGQISRMSSNQPVNMVLELNSGWLMQNNVKIGDTVAGLD